MGYTTEFEGEFKTSRPLTKTEFNYINKFAETRRMKRDVEKLMEMHNGDFGHPTRKDNPYGIEGEFFVGGKGFMGQDSDKSVIDDNTPPGQLSWKDEPNWNKMEKANRKAIVDGKAQPGLWCQWVMSDKSTLKWDGNEKFYCYLEWLEYLINNFFKEWDIKLNGIVKWRGEDFSDIGVIQVKNNKVKVLQVWES